MLLMLTPLMIEGRLNPEAVLEQSRLGEFADTLVRHKAVVEHTWVLRFAGMPRTNPSNNLDES